MEDGRCKLGLAGRLELVRLVKQGRAGDGTQVVASVEERLDGRARLQGVLAGQGAGSEVVSVVVA